MSDRIVRRAPGPQQLLARILDEPELVRAVQALEPRALGRLIDHVGLEDAGELVALAQIPPPALHPLSAAWRRKLLERRTV